MTQDYDVRSNVVRSCAIPKSRAGLACDSGSGDIATTTVYPKERPFSIAPTRSRVTSPQPKPMPADTLLVTLGTAGSGLPTKIESALDGSFACALSGGNCPEVDLTYTSYSGLGSAGGTLHLLTQKSEKVDATHNMVAAYAYDSTNHYVLLTGTTDPSGLNLTTTLAFDSIGNLTQVDGPRTDVADVMNFTWDAERRILMRIEADPDAGGSLPRPATKYAYDLDGLVTRIDTGTTTSPIGAGFTAVLTTLQFFDSAGNKIKAVTPAGVTQYSFDADDRPSCTAIRMNAAVYGSLPASACSLSTLDATVGPDRITQTVYDAASEVTQEIRALGIVYPYFPETQEQLYAAYTYTPNWAESDD